MFITSVLEIYIYMYKTKFLDTGSLSLYELRDLTEIVNLLFSRSSNT